MDIQYGNLNYLNLLWVVAGLVGLMIVAAILRRRALARFATSNLVQRITAGISGPRRLVKGTCLVVALMLIAIGLADIRWGKVWREVPQKGIDVMFVVDVSRSMLAEDANPSRLERARQQIGDMIAAMHGDRIGLVVFAGDAKQVSPMTTNYNDFKQTLAMIGPQSVIRGGSRLGDALSLASKGFLDQTDDHKAIVVFTDGEDQESDPVDVARKLYTENGIRVFTIGLGDTEQGARIPVARDRAGTQWLEHDGVQVWSKLNGTILKEVASAGSGAWIPAGTKQVDMAGVYRSYVANIEQKEFESARIHAYVARFQWFLIPALMLLIIESLLTDRRVVSVNSQSESAGAGRREQTTDETSHTKWNGRHGRLVASALFIGLMGLGATEPGAAPDASSLLTQANAAVEAGDYHSAIQQYREVATLRPNRWEPIYNEAIAHYRNGEIDTARRLFIETLATKDSELEGKARFNLANCDYAEGVALAEQDRPAAIAKLKSAITHYRETLAMNKTDTDARVNIELAQRLIDKLQRQEEQEKQDQQQQDQKQDNEEQQDQKQRSEQQKQDSSQNPEPNDKQQREEQKNQEQQSQGRQPKSPMNDEQQPNHSSSDQQQGNSEPKQDSSHQQSPKGKQGDKPQEGSTTLSDNRDNSPPGTQNAQDHNPKSMPAGETQPPQDQQPSGEPQTTGPTPSGTGQQTEGLPPVGQSAGMSAERESRPMTQIEAEKMLQSVRDRDLRRRIERLRAERMRAVPVDRDW